MCRLWSTENLTISSKSIKTKENGKLTNENKDKDTHQANLHSNRDFSRHFCRRVDFNLFCPVQAEFCALRRKESRFWSQALQDRGALWKKYCRHGMVLCAKATGNWDSVFWRLEARCVQSACSGCKRHLGFVPRSSVRTSPWICRTCPSSLRKRLQYRASISAFSWKKRGNLHHFWHKGTLWCARLAFESQWNLWRDISSLCWGHFNGLCNGSHGAQFWPSNEHSVDCCWLRLHFAIRNHVESFPKRQKFPASTPFARHWKPHG